MNADSEGNVWETTKLASHCKKVASPIALPLILKGKTSGSMTQTVAT